MNRHALPLVHLITVGLFTSARLESQVVGGTPSAASTGTRGSTDRASDYGSEGWGFESLRVRKTASDWWEREQRLLFLLRVTAAQRSKTF